MTCMRLLVIDQAAVADLADIRDDEFYVEIPRMLLRFAQDGELRG
jgi:hypothetical protein